MWALEQGLARGGIRRHLVYVRRATTSLVSAITVSLVGCAGLDTRLPEINLPQLSQEEAYQQGLAFAEMDRLQARLMSVADRIRIANAPLCPKVRPGIGVKTHTLNAYSKSLRDAARRELGASEEPRVLTVTTGSSAALAGVRQGDALIVDGKAVSHSSDEFLDALKSGEIVVRHADGKVESLSVTPVEECAYDVRLKVTSDINAYATGSSVTITSGMMKFVDSDEELALIVGHELAHNTMGHIRKIVGNYILSLGATRYARPFESEADYVGLYYLARADYDMAGVEDVWRRLALISPQNTSRAKTHPTSSERFLRISAARAEITAKQENGITLIPNFKSGDG